MTISNLDGIIAAAKQRLSLTKTASQTTNTNPFWQSLFSLAGDPGAGTLAGSSTTAGVVPTSSTAGYPTINAFGTGNLGYLSRAAFGSNIACRIRIYDRLFLCGAYSFNANTALTSPPSYSGRLPNTNYVGLELWAEQVTAATGIQGVTVTYTNQAGTTGQSTGAVSQGTAGKVGQCWPLGLAAGDTGVQAISNVAGSTASAGTFNVMVLRPLADARIKIANDADIQDLLRTGLPQLYATSALYILASPDSGTASPIVDCQFDVING